MIKIILSLLLLAQLTAGCTRNSADYHVFFHDSGKPDGAPLAGEILKAYAERASIEAAHGDRITPVLCLNQGWNCHAFNQCVVEISIDKSAKAFSDEVIKCGKL